MCCLCVEVAKNSMDIKSIARAYLEMPMENYHYQEFAHLLIDKGIFKEVVDEVTKETINRALQRN